MYLTYEEYLARGGNLSSPAFVRYAFMAEAEIDLRTQNRIRSEFDGGRPYAEKLAALCVELIELYERSERLLSGNRVLMESNDGYSRHYAFSADSDVRREAQIAALFLRFLGLACTKAGVSLLYRGGREGAAL